MKKIVTIHNGVIVADVPDNDPHARDAMLEALEFMRAVEQMQRGVRKGGEEAGRDRHDRSVERDQLIREHADKDTGDPRTRAARLAKRRWPTLTDQRDADGKPVTETLTARTIRNALQRTAKEKRKRA